MISTTLNNHALMPVGKVRPHVSTHRRGAAKGRDWTLLMVFLISPVIMFSVSAAALVYALG